MAERRMFAKTIIDSDAFLEMPQSSQLLYFHLSMRGDDDGFINKPKSIMTMVGCKDDDLKLLIAKKFIIPFDTGIVVIKHWKIHNYIAKDRYNETKYKDEKSQLVLDENNSYRLISNNMYTDCIQPVYEMDTQVRLGKVSIDKINKSSCPKNKFSDDSIQIILAQKLYLNMQANNPGAKKPNYQVWAKHVDLMLSVDNRNPNEIEKVIDWCQQDSFWFKNILSTEKLRKQYDKLYIGMTRANKPTNTKPKSTDSNQHILDEIGDEYFT